MQTKHIKEKLKETSQTKHVVSLRSQQLSDSEIVHSSHERNSKPGTLKSDEGIGAHTCSPLISISFFTVCSNLLPKHRNFNSKHS